MTLQAMLRRTRWAIRWPRRARAIVRRCAGSQTSSFELGYDRTTLLHLRRLLERHGLINTAFGEAGACRSDKSIALRSGPPTDATVIDAYSSTENKVRTRDEEMSSIIKGRAVTLE